MRLRYTARARSDLGEIHDYISQENPDAARRIILLIRRAAESLLENPKIGRTGRVEGTRELTISRFPFMVSYRIVETEVQILAVIHTARLWPEDFQG
jgi:toxin ParE1/3/4